jgi:hypothetical protein
MLSFVRLVVYNISEVAAYKMLLLVICVIVILKKRGGSAHLEMYT